MTAVPSVWIAFLAGILSFVSPCCLPLYPSYISYISGVSIDRSGSGLVTREARRRALAHAVFFVLGFSVIFVALGASASLLGTVFAEYKPVISRIGGVIIIVMGLVLLGVIKSEFLAREFKWQVKSRRSGYLGAFVVGVSFSAGWTPCIGPILASVITVAATSEVSGGLLMAVYALGFALPFLLLAYTLGSVRWLQKYSELTSRIGGAVMIAMGLLLLTGRMTLITAWLIRLFGGYVGP